MLREVHGVAQPPRARRRPEPHLWPHALDELVEAARRAADAPEGAGADVVRVRACGLAGAALPTRARPEPVEVTVTTGQPLVAGHAVTLPAEMPAPDPGTVDVAAVDRGRRVGRPPPGVQLDLRRLELTRLTELVRSCRPRWCWAMPGVGRDRLTAAVTAAGATDQQRLRAWLRRPPLR